MRKICTCKSYNVTCSTCFSYELFNIRVTRNLEKRKTRETSGNLFWNCQGMRKEYLEIKQHNKY